jgi:hypothetical protein
MLFVQYLNYASFEKIRMFGIPKTQKENMCEAETCNMQSLLWNANIFLNQLPVRCCPDYERTTLSHTILDSAALTGHSNACLVLCVYVCKDYFWAKTFQEAGEPNGKSTVLTISLWSVWRDKFLGTHKTTFWEEMIIWYRIHVLVVRCSLKSSGVFNQMYSCYV